MWGGLAVVIVAIVVAFLTSELAPPAKVLPAGESARLSAFNLTNQDNQRVTLESLRGQVWLADVIFTRCPGPCAKMTRSLVELQKALPLSEGVRLVTLTSDPDYDTPAALGRYASRFGADTNRWSFLTGNKQEIRRLEVNDFKFSVLEKEPGQREVPDDLFIHSTFFVLVDREGRARHWVDPQGQIHAYFDMDEPNFRPQILAAIKQLASEK